MDSGIVRLDDEDITHFSGKKLARNMAVMGQFNQINFDYTVLDIALMGRYPFHSLLEQERERDYEIALEALDKVGMKSYRDRNFQSLSGGEKQRVVLARALTQSPKILILDEPTAGLDPAGRESILKNIRDYQAAQQAAVVMVSHSMEEIASNVDRLIVMEKGTAVMTDAPSEVFSHAAELVSMGLNVPCMTQVLLRLQQLGVNVPASAYTVEQAADLLEPLLKGGAQIC